MHTFQVQQLNLQSQHSGTPQCKSLQLQASRVTIATATLTVQPGTCLCIYTRAVATAGNGYQVRVPVTGHLICEHLIPGIEFPIGV